MTEIETVKNAQRLYHIIQAIARIRLITNDLSNLDEKVRDILNKLNLPEDLVLPELP